MKYIQVFHWVNEIFDLSFKHKENHSYSDDLKTKILKEIETKCLKYKFKEIDNILIICVDNKNFTQR